MKTTYKNGDKAVYTGKSEIVYGKRLFEIKMVEGHLKGEIKSTYKCPDCNIGIGQDQPTFNQCETCKEV